MQKLRSKLGLLIVFSCLTLAVGLMASTGSASAHQAGSRHRPSPRITMRVLPGRFTYHGRHVERAVIYGIGFNGCGSCANASAYDGCSSSCNSGCNNSYYANACGSSSACGNACGSSSACGNACSSSNDGCPSDCSSGSPSGCANYHACGSASGSVSVGGSGVNVNGSNGGHVSVGASGISISGSTSCSSACGSASTSCSSYNGCSDGGSCDCANVQSTIPIYGQSVNLSQVPVNAFGEFHITVLVLVPAHPARMHYRMWAINRYNNDCSNILSGPQNW